MQINPYLNFDGRTEEALKFYRDAIGAHVGMVMRFKDLPPGTPTMGPLPPADKIMHASFRIGDTVVFASDGQCAGKGEFKGVTLSLQAASDADAVRLFAALSEAGQVHMPLAETFFATSFGMLSDKFGVAWMVIVEKPMPVTQPSTKPAAKAKSKSAAPAKKAGKRAG